MYILAIETTGPQCSVAIINEEGKVKSLKSDGRLNHLQYLTPMIDELVRKCELQLDDVTAIAASRGPGSFTGIRIGVTTARALCQAINVPAIAVPTLKTFAYRTCEENILISPIFDARRNQVYAGAYVMKDGRAVEITKGGAYDLDEYLDALIRDAEEKDAPRKILLIGDGTVPYGETAKKIIEEKGFECTLSGETQDAESVARLALEMYNDSETVGYGELLPDYMRKAEAERKLEEARKKKEQNEKQ